MPHKAAPKPARAPESPPPIPSQLQAAPKPTAPVYTGVYLTGSRETAVVVRVLVDGVWFLTMRSGRAIDLEFMGFERFLHEFPVTLPGYPILRAVRKYQETNLPRDERVEKVMRVILRTGI